MKLQEKIVLINCSCTIVISLLLSINSGGNSRSTFIGGLGTITFVIGLLQIIAGIFLLLMKDKRYAQGFIIAGGILLFIGFVTCTTQINSF